VNVWQDTTLRNGDMSQKFVQLLIVADGELEVTGNDTGLLVVTGGVTSQFEDFSSKVFEHGGEIDGSASTNTLGVVALSQQTMDTADGECEASFRGPTVEKAPVSGNRCETGHVMRVGEGGWELKATRPIDTIWGTRSIR
jgi:hypothetical protein